MEKRKRRETSASGRGKSGKLRKEKQALSVERKGRSTLLGATVERDGKSSGVE